MLASVDELETLVAGNEIFLARTKGIGVLPPEVAASYGVSGPNLRASGVKFDLRKVEDYLPYDRFDFEIPVGENGDCWDRWWVRLAEIRQSVTIIQQAIDGLPSGALQAKVPKIIKVPKGETYVRAENPKGEMGYTSFPMAGSVLIGSKSGRRVSPTFDSALDSRGCARPRLDRDHGKSRLCPRRRGQMSHRSALARSLLSALCFPDCGLRIADCSEVTK